jgi:two-component sensor histidine kinase
LAILSVQIAALPLIFARNALPENTPFLLFFAAVALSSGFGGIGPGVFATLLSALACDFLLVTPLRSISVAEWTHLPLALFILVALLDCAFTEVLHVAQVRSEASRAEAEAARRRVAFLAEASVLLDASLDYRDTLASLARLAVPRMADWCVIHVLDEHGGLHPVAAAHTDPSKEELIRGLDIRYPLDAQGANPVHKALATGLPAVLLDITDSALTQSARDADHLQLLRKLNMRSYICVPLRARDRTLGAILFVAASRRRYTASDVDLAHDLARRAALAADSAVLYKAAQTEIAERKRAQEDLQRSQEMMNILNERLKRSVTETHHRVKNSLQLVSAMVDMLVMDHGRTVPTKEVKRLAAHIRTLAAVHDTLTRELHGEGEAETVSVHRVLDKLLPMMQETSNRPIEYEVDDALLPAPQATSLALLVNELVSNAVKHGHGEVKVRLKRLDRAAVLEVRDDGPGFPAGFDPSRAANTGLELVESLSRWDLGGTTSYETRPEGGGCVRVTIPVNGARQSEG